MAKPRYYLYKVIEDNGGGLFLELYLYGKLRYVFNNWECSPGVLSSALDMLDSGDAAPIVWDSSLPDPEAFVEHMNSFEFGHKLICSGWKGKRTFYPNRMGGAGQLEFSACMQSNNPSFEVSDEN